MKPMNFESFEKALSQLEAGLAELKKHPDHDLLRDGVIQRFEYCFELAWKMLKRRLEIEIQNSEEVDGYSKKRLFRVGGEKGLIADVDAWLAYLDQRNLTTHTYEGETAAAVAAAAQQFSASAAQLLHELKARNEED